MAIKRSIGKPFPFGANRHEQGINFALYAPQASQVALIIYHSKERELISEYKLNSQINRTGHVWHIQLTGLEKQICYGYRVNENRMFPEKTKTDEHLILLDPYAKMTCGGKEWGTPQTIQRDGHLHTFRLAAFPDQNFEWEGDRPLNTPLQDTIIYELHVRGFTKHKSSNVKKAGVFEGLIEKIPYFVELGITAVELMPITDFDETYPRRQNPQSGETLYNYWGYDPINFFAIKESYAYSQNKYDATISFKKMVQAFHQAGIEIILDLVYNHTGEGNHDGPVYNFKSLNSQIYYLIDNDDEFANYSGCGNTVNCNHPVVAEMILDSLRYWVTEMHVDGFRFDLASILGRGQDGSALKNPPLIERITEDPILSNTKLIAEAWDAAGLYQVGKFPGGRRWMEWNGLFRDDVRRFLRGDPGMIPKIATRLSGSSDLYEENGRTPFNGVNFITCHDGFTLNDLVSYHNKHNEANGEDNRDGSDLNFSWNCGKEGKTDDANILFLRSKQSRNFAAILLLSQGIPMIYGGDEFMNTKDGNNNAYCQDNETGWLNWKTTDDNTDLLRFFQRLIQFRKEHINLRRSSFIVRKKNGMPEMSWHGTRNNQPDWSEKSQTLAIHYTANLNDPNNIYIILNGSPQTHTFQLPEPSVKAPWRLIMNTAHKPPDDIYRTKNAPLLQNQHELIVKDKSVVLLISKRCCPV